MYCGNCFRDNALVAQLRRMGHHALMIPLYLPFTLDEADQSEGTPLFFSGLNVYLGEKFDCFQKAPKNPVVLIVDLSCFVMLIKG